MKLIFLFFSSLNLLLISNQIFSDDIQASYTSWFTGPLLTPAPVNMDPDHPVIEPSFQLISTYGNYDSHWEFEGDSNMWTIKPLVDFQMGFTKKIGLEVIAAATANFKKGASSIRFTDTIFRFGVQVLNDKRGSWIPDFRIDLQETVPTGSYQKLNIKKNGTDLSGQGSFQTGVLFNFQKTFYAPNDHRFSIRSSLGYLFPAPVHVKGLNAYGGGRETRGKIYPGQIFQIYLSGEYSLSDCWAIVTEWLYFQNARNRFSGKQGIQKNGELSIINTSSSNQLSATIEIERTFTARLGMLIGVWGTLTGRNAPAFLSNFISFLYVF